MIVLQYENGSMQIVDEPYGLRKGKLRPIAVMFMTDVDEWTKHKVMMSMKVN